jgi:hypothetical protein
MLFLVIQDHDPALCPQRDGLGPDALFQEIDGVKVRYAVADVPGHRLAFLLEADSYEAIQEFLEPGRTRCTTDISPVLDLSVT